jgi:hypothetical protein
MPVDAHPVVGGTFRLIRNPDPLDRTPRAEFVPKHIRGAEPLYISHFATCPMAEHHRKAKASTSEDEGRAQLAAVTDSLTAAKLADELIEITRARVGHWPTYLECREDWKAFCASHPDVPRKVLELVAEPALRKLHPVAAEIGDRVVERQQRRRHTHHHHVHP